MSWVFRSVHGSTSVSCEAMLLDQMRILSNESGNMFIKATTKKTSPKIKQNFVHLQLVNLSIYCKWKAWRKYTIKQQLPPLTAAKLKTNEKIQGLKNILEDWDRGILFEVSLDQMLGNRNMLELVGLGYTWISQSVSYTCAVYTVKPC